MSGDDFPVTGGFPLPDDIDESPEYKFILVNDQTGDHICDLDTRFVRDEGIFETEGYPDCPDVWSSDAACAEALYKLGYNVKVVKK